MGAFANFHIFIGPLIAEFEQASMQRPYADLVSVLLAAPEAKESKEAKAVAHQVHWQPYVSGEEEGSKGSEKGRKLQRKRRRR